MGKKIEGRLIVTEEAITTDVIKKLIDRYAHEGASAKELRIAALCSLGFAGFFRFNELSNIQRNHIAFHDEFVKIFVPCSKTDVHREGNFVYVSKTHLNY